MVSNRIYNNDRVVDKLGIKDKKYDKIDVFVDEANKNNLWGILYYTEYQKNRPIVKKEIKEFLNYNDMITFVKSNFNGYELNHQVDYRYRQVFLHVVDYLNIDYYLHEGRPSLNYLELYYKEYINGNFHLKKIELPQEYENMLVKIIKKSKKIDNNSIYNSGLINTIDVYAKRSKRSDYDKESNQQEKRLGVLKNISNMQKKEKRIKNLKVSIALASLVTILTTTGIVLVKDNNIDKYGVITQKNKTLSMRDINISYNKDKIGAIIDKLMNSDYENVTGEDLKIVIRNIKEIENSNYDNNRSINYFNYVDYFSYKILENDSEIHSVADTKLVLEKIEKLYRNCFNHFSEYSFTNDSALNAYLDYVLSLAFMYDVNVDLRGSKEVPMNNQSITSRYAVKKEIETYNNYPPILKYIILNQLKNVLYHSKYQVTERPSNYFKDLDKMSLMNEVSSRIDKVLEELKRQCNHQKSR